MKRNIVPLLGIAFVVAIISTGVFYGLFAGKLRSSSDLGGRGIVVAARDLDRGTVLQASDLRVDGLQGALEGAFSEPRQVVGATLLTAMKANEPLLQERVSGSASGAGATGLVPSGMRAVALHIVQSESLLSMLHPGSRVDLQAVADRNGTPELRTVLENVQVLATGSLDANGRRTNGSIVTVLVRASDTDMVALADAGSRMRVALRNPQDEGISRHSSLGLAELFSSGGNEDRQRRERSRLAAAAVWDHPVQLHVRVLSASDGAVEQLRAHCSPLGSDRSWRVAAFDSDPDPAKLIHSLEGKHEAEVLSSERLMAGVGRPISYRAGAKPSLLRVQFSPEWLPSGKLALRVKPQAGIPDAPGAATINYDVGLADDASFLIEGIAAGDASVDNLAARVFPGRSWEHHHLLIFVSARMVQQNSEASVARANRGR